VKEGRKRAVAKKIENKEIDKSSFDNNYTKVNEL
jgi:hypothetical protein